MPEPLTLSAAFDHRFGTLQLNVKSLIHLKLVDLIKELDIPPEEIAALLEDRYQWTEGREDIEPARVRALAETEMGGKVVLDIGGYDGYMAAQALRQGAKRAICLDNQQYEHYGWQEKKLPGVEYVTGDLMQWGLMSDSGTDELWCTDEDKVDILINYNTLYHVKNPWRFLDKCRAVIKENGVMLLCSLFRYQQGPWLYIYEPRECNPEDETVYFGPSLEALERLLKATGWTAMQEGLAYDRVVYRCLPTPGFVRAHEDT